VLLAELLERLGMGSVSGVGVGSRSRVRGGLPSHQDVLRLVD